MLQQFEGKLWELFTEGYDLRLKTAKTWICNVCTPEIISDVRDGDACLNIKYSTHDVYLT